ncbi:MAG: hypothetical protein U0P46_00725 [Holophagaceae bacterium]
MTHLRAWCQTPLPGPESIATHGLCPACRLAFEHQRGTEVLAWVEEAPHPAVAVDREVRIRAANQAACDLLQADWVTLLGQPLSEALGSSPPHFPGPVIPSLSAGEVVALRLDPPPQGA